MYHNDDLIWFVTDSFFMFEYCIVETMRFIRIIKCEIEKMEQIVEYFKFFELINENSRLRGHIIKLL